MGTLVLIEQAASVLVGLLNVFGATKKVSGIIAAQISEGRTTWTDEERASVRGDLASAKATADQQIRDAGA